MLDQSSLHHIVLVPDEDGGYVAEIPELPGVVSQGETVDEAVANAREAAELYLEFATPPDPPDRALQGSQS